MMQRGAYNIEHMPLLPICGMPYSGIGIPYSETGRLNERNPKSGKVRIQ